MPSEPCVTLLACWKPFSWKEKLKETTKCRASYKLKRSINRPNKIRSFLIHLEHVLEQPQKGRRLEMFPSLSHARFNFHLAPTPYHTTHCTHNDDDIIIRTDRVHQSANLTFPDWLGYLMTFDCRFEPEKPPPPLLGTNNHRPSIALPSGTNPSLLYHAMYYMAECMQDWRDFLPSKRPTNTHILVQIRVSQSKTTNMMETLREIDIKK